MYNVLILVDENNFFESEGSDNKFLNADERKDFIQEFHQKEKKEKDQDQGSFCSQTLSQYQPLV